jgi:hypothetical protein
MDNDLKPKKAVTKKKKSAKPKQKLYDVLMHPDEQYERGIHEGFAMLPEFMRERPNAHPAFIKFISAEVQDGKTMEYARNMFAAAMWREFFNEHQDRNFVSQSNSVYRVTGTNMTAAGLTTVLKLLVGNVYAPGGKLDDWTVSATPKVPKAMASSVMNVSSPQEGMLRGTLIHRELEKMCANPKYFANKSRSDIRRTSEISSIEAFLEKVGLIPLLSELPVGNVVEWEQRKSLSYATRLDLVAMHTNVKHFGELQVLELKLGSRDTFVKYTGLCNFPDDWLVSRRFKRNTPLNSALFQAALGRYMFTQQFNVPVPVGASVLQVIDAALEWPVDQDLIEMTPHLYELLAALQRNQKCIVNYQLDIHTGKPKKKTTNKPKMHAMKKPTSSLVYL